MISHGRRIPEQLRRLADAADHYIDAAVTIEVAERGAAVPSHLLKVLACALAHIEETSAAQARKHQIWLSRLANGELFHVAVDRAAGRKQVLPSVIVEIIDPVTPPGMRRGLASNPGRIGNVGE